MTAASHTFPFLGQSRVVTDIGNIPATKVSFARPCLDRCDDVTSAALGSLSQIVAKEIEKTKNIACPDRTKVHRTDV